MGRRAFLKALGGAGAGAALLGAGEALALRHFRPTEDFPAGDAYRTWEDLYRNQWTWDRVVRGTHTYNCNGQCLFDVYVKGGVVWREEQASVYPQLLPDMPDPNPRGCNKGCIHSRQMYQGDRLLYPLKRAGQRGEGKWQRISWDQAATEIAEKVLDIIQRDGPGHIQFFGSGRGTISSLGLGRLADLLGELRPVGDEDEGDAFTGAWLTYAAFPPDRGATRSGTVWFPGYNTFFAKYVLLQYFNPQVTAIPDVHYLWEARYNGAKVVVVSPEYSPTAIHADVWLPIKPDTDNAMMMAMIRTIINEGLVDVPYVKEQTDLPFLVRRDTGKYLREADLVSEGRRDNFFVWDTRSGGAVLAPGTMGQKEKTLKLGEIDPALEGEFEVSTLVGSVLVRPVFHVLKERVQEWTPEKAAGITGLHPQDILQVAREFASSKPAIILNGYGQCKHFHGELAGRAQALVLALTGNVGRGGTAGGRTVAWDTQAFRVGALARYVSGSVQTWADNGYLGIARAYYGPEMKEALGYGPEDIQEFLQARVTDGTLPYYGPSRAMIVFGSNPLAHSKNSQRRRDNMVRSLDLLVHIDLRMASTGQYADYVLPAAAQYERIDLNVDSGGNGVGQPHAAAVDPLGEAMSDYNIAVLLARKISETALAREFASFEDKRFGVTRDLAGLYDAFTASGRFDNDEKVADAIVGATEATKGMTYAQFLEQGAAFPTRPLGLPVPFEAQWERKVPYGTLTGRQQIYQDADWNLQWDEALVTYKPDPAPSRYPLRFYSGHARHGVHSYWRSNKYLLRLQRGEPVVQMNPDDAADRGIKDGERTRVFNNIGGYLVQAKLTPGLPRGMLFSYHGWDPSMFPDHNSFEAPFVAIIKPSEMVNGEGHVERWLPGRGIWGPNLKFRPASVEVQKA